MQNKYVTQEATKSRCAKCGNRPHLLAPEFATDPQLPFFYICWHCKQVSQAGVGPVRFEGGDRDLYDVAKRVTLKAGLPYTHPVTGETTEPPEDWKATQEPIPQADGYSV